MAAWLSRALGQEVRYQPVTPAAYRAFGFPGADDLGNMFQFNHDFSDDFCAARSVEFSRSVNPALQSFDGWLAANAKRIRSGEVAGRAAPRRGVDVRPQARLSVPAARAIRDSRGRVGPRTA